MGCLEVACGAGWREVAFSTLGRGGNRLVFRSLWIGGWIYIMYTREGGTKWKKFSPIFGGTDIFALSLQSQTKRGAQETDKMMNEKITSVVLVV